MRRVGRYFLWINLYLEKKLWIFFVVVFFKYLNEIVDVIDSFKDSFWPRVKIYVFRITW